MTILDLLTEAGRRRARREALVSSLCSGRDCARFVKENKEYRRILVSPCPSEPGKYRATQFIVSSPVGHVVYDTMTDAVDDVLRMNYIPEVPNHE